MKSPLRLSPVRRRLTIAGTIAFIVCAALAGPAVNALGAGPSPAPQGPAASAKPPVLPRPAAVTVDPATTAYLVLDMTTAVCAPSPACVKTLPAAAALLAKARAAGATVIYSETGAAGSQILPQVAPQPADPVVTAHADKFNGTDLNQILQADGIKTLVIVGTVVNGAVLYTTFEAGLNGYTAVVAEDGVSAASAYVMNYSLFQLLNEPGFTNAGNTPLAPGAVTLSAGPLITFQAAG